MDRRLQAVFLLRRGGKENRDQAQLILQQLLADPKAATATDRIYLADLLEQDGRSDEARRELAILAGQDKVRPEHLAGYIGFLLRHDTAAEASAEADKQLKRLETMAPEHPNTIGLRARWLQAQKRSKEIAPLVEAWAKKVIEKVKEPDQEAQACETVGNLYAATEQFPDAERWYRRLLKTDAKRFDLLATVLARQNRMGEVVGLCAEAAKTDSSARPALVLAGVLGTGQPTAEDLKQAEPLVMKAAAENKDNVEAQSAVAGLRVLQGRMDEAAAMYRRLLALNPKDVLTRNNLATLLGESAETRKDGLAEIDKAIKQVGPQPALLDTKGTILMYDGRTEEAIALLKQATSGPQPDPRSYLHLAAACDLARDTAGARAAWKNAEKGDLKRQILMSSDQKLIQDLEKKYRS